MKLVIVTISHQVSWCSHNVGVPPLVIEGTMGNSMAINIRMVSFRTRCELNILFNPIDNNSNTKSNKSVLPKQITKEQHLYTRRKINQCKQVPPHKLQCLFGFCPRDMHVSHLVPPYQYDQVSIDFYAKTTIKLQNIKELQLVCPLFNNRFIFQGKHREPR